MIITESLAKGLKNRFFLEISDEINQRLKLASLIGKPGKKSTAAWLRYQNKFKEIFGRCAVIYYSGGSNKKPYFALIGLSIDEKREFNQWDEKCISGHMVVISYEPKIAEDMFALFNIGEHAISRVFERGVVSIKNDTQVDIFSILPEFKYVPIWSGFWTFVFQIFKLGYPNQNDLNQIYPVIPAKSGLLLGQIGHERFEPLEIRTFVDDSHLNFEQQEVKKAMLEISHGIESSPLCFFPIPGSLGLDDDNFQTGMICYELLKRYDLVSSVIFHRVVDDQLRYKLKEQFKKCLLDLSRTINEELITLLRKIGIKNMQLEIKKALLKQKMLSK